MLFISIIVILFGLLMGSFIDCLAWRLHKGETMMNRSYCPHCKQIIAWYDNLPVLSWLLLKARCRHCKHQISWQYPLFELVVGLLFFFVFYYRTGYFGIFSEYYQLFDWRLLLTIVRDWILIGGLILIFIMDMRWYVIVDKVSLSLAAVILILNLILGMPWLGLTISAIIGAGFFLLQFVVSGGKWIGGGDIRLGLLMGLALGWPHILVALFAAYLLGAVFGLGLMAAGKKQFGSKLPCGTFLSVATIITMFYGNELLQWYVRVFNF
jgi:prepilin signal peptidase PulO-like enzyme (type II secretory pathway)